MVKNKPVKDGRIRSFNLSTDAIKKMERGAQIEGLSRSAYIERLIITNDHSRRVAQDVKKGIQTTLRGTGLPTPAKPRLNSMCKVCMTDNNTNGHLQFIKGTWQLVCPNKEVKA
jgi:hypothetical protein